MIKSFTTNPGNQLKACTRRRDVLRYPRHCSDVPDTNGLPESHPGNQSDKPDCQTHHGSASLALACVRIPLSPTQDLLNHRLLAPLPKFLIQGVYSVPSCGGYFMCQSSTGQDLGNRCLCSWATALREEAARSLEARLSYKSLGTLSPWNHQVSVQCHPALVPVSSTKHSSK